MKKLLIILSFVFVSSILYGEGINGIFGIKFGENPNSVKGLMAQKEWVLTGKEGSSLVFKKNGGTFAGMYVEEIKLYFYKEQFYGALINYSLKTNTEDVIAALPAIQDAFSLTFQKDETTMLDDCSVLTYSFTDPKYNIFKFNIIIYKSIKLSCFELYDLALYGEKVLEEAGYF